MMKHTRRTMIIAGLAIAHDRAVTIFPDRRIALRSQLPSSR